nr:DUF2381 family protein [Melittangium boletus]
MSTRFLRRWLSVLLVLWALPTMAETTPVHRAIHLTKNPTREVPDVHVAGGRVTTLRFEQPCDPERTKLLGWEGRFEPLAVWGRSVSLVPFKDLSPGDRFLLLVTMRDGTELPLTVTGGGMRWDAQVDVFSDPDSSEAVRVALDEVRERNQTLHEENLRHREEETSVDHALAALLARNEISMTPFQPFDAVWLLEEGMKIRISVLTSRKKATRKKVAIVFKVKNTDSETPWTLMRARVEALMTEKERPFALRAFPESISPGETGRVAIVADLSSFDSKKEGDRLVFTLFRDEWRHLGRIVLYVDALPL